METIYCVVEGCGVELTDENWSPSQRRKNIKMCQECDDRVSQAWIADNSDRVMEGAARHLCQHPLEDFSMHISTRDDETLPTMDVKSAFLAGGGWQFHIGRITNVDYFVLVARDNQTDGNILYVWRIPGYVLGHLESASISQSNVDKWSDYEQDVPKIIARCNAMKVDSDDANEGGVTA